MVDVALRYFEDVFNALLEGALPLGQIGASQVAWQNTTFVPTKGQPYIRTETAARVRTPMGVGRDAVQMWTGTFQVSIFVPRDTGTRDLNDAASAVLALFPRGYATQTPQDITVTISRGTAPAAVPYGDWINQPVQIEWFATEPP